MENEPFIDDLAVKKPMLVYQRVILECIDFGVPHSWTAVAFLYNLRMD